MARPSKQIGWSQEANLYYELLKQLERLTAVMSKVTLEPATTTTTTTVPPPNPIVIGSQIWSDRNLEVVTYRNGDPIPQVTDPTAWAALTTGAWCYYGNSSGNGVVYGKLYNWYAVNDPRGLAPLGWHIPTTAEWTTLSDYLGGLLVAAGAMKETGITHWADPNTGATNSSGLTVLPAGKRLFIGTIFSFLTTSAYHWSSTEVSATSAAIRWMWNTDGILRNANDNKKSGLAVRLVKD